MVEIISSKSVRGGSPVIKGTRLRVLDIGIKSEYFGMSPDDIIRAHPSLTLAQVHAALAYFHNHIKEMREKIRAQSAIVEQLRKEYGSKIAIING